MSSTTTTSNTRMEIGLGLPQVGTFAARTLETLTLDTRPTRALAGHRLGERQSRDWIDYGRPDVNGHQLRRFKRARIAVVGDGENVDRVLIDLDQLARLKPGTTVTHVTARRDPTAPPGALAHAPSRVEGFRVHGFCPTEGGVMLEGDDGRWIGPFDRLIVDDMNDAA